MKMEPPVPLFCDIFGCRKPAEYVVEYETWWADGTSPTATRLSPVKKERSVRCAEHNPTI